MKFSGKIIRIGASFGVIVPKAYIDNEQLALNKQYTIIIEVNSDEKTTDPR